MIELNIRFNDRSFSEWRVVGLPYRLLLMVSERSWCADVIPMHSVMLAIVDIVDGRMINIERVFERVGIVSSAGLDLRG